MKNARIIKWEKEHSSGIIIFWILQTEEVTGWYPEFWEDGTSEHIKQDPKTLQEYAREKGYNLIHDESV